MPSTNHFLSQFPVYFIVISTQITGDRGTQLLFGCAKKKMESTSFKPSQIQSTREEIYLRWGNSVSDWKLWELVIE